MNKRIIGLVGDIAAGKSTATEYIKQTHGATTYRFSTILRDIAKRLYLEENREHLQQLSTIIRQQFGDDILSKSIAHDVIQDNHPLIIVEGLRRPSDSTYLEQQPGFQLIYITADERLRWERLTKRGENKDDATKTFEQFKQDEQAEADSLIKDIAKKATHVIINNGTKEELYAHIDTIINQ